MELTRLTADAHDFFVALGYAQPRILAMLAVLPIFSTAAIPPLIRVSVGSVLGLLVAPVLLPAVHQDIAPFALLLTFVKEAFVGFTLGFFFAIPFWAFEATGVFIDNQRGATIAAILDPLTGADSSPLGQLFSHAFVVFFLISGGFQLVVGALYDSFSLWPVFEWTPTLRQESVPLLLGQLDRLVRLAMLYGAPVIVAMFMAEFGLALISRFVPQLQVFFLAMPIKSAIAMFILVIYGATLFDLCRDDVAGLGQVVRKMQGEWRPAGSSR